MGDVTNSGSNGTPEKQVKSWFGKPASSTKTELSGTSTKATQYVWTDVNASLKGASVTVSFLNGKAVGKGYTDAKISNKLSSATLKEITTGTSLKDAQKKLGTPSGQAIVGNGTTSTQLLTYTDGSKSVGFSFVNNVLTSKTETNIK